MLQCVKKIDYLFNKESEIRYVCHAVEGHCLLTMKIVHQHANGRFDWLISGHESVNPSREAISILSGKYERFMFVSKALSTLFRPGLLRCLSITL